jgi:arylsulfatase A-like enzyme
MSREKRITCPLFSILCICIVGSVAFAGGVPNILLVSIDSLRADHLQCYGYERDTSPNLDALGAEGVRFETALSPTSWTLPAHLTMLTSLPPEEHGVNADNRWMRGDLVFLAEVLKEKGFHTAGFVSGPYLKRPYGFSQGFDHYDDFSIKQTNFKGNHEGTTSDKLIQLVDTWLSERVQSNDGKPFFIFLHMWDVHYDYTPPPPYDSMFDPDYQGSISWKNFEHNPAVCRTMDTRDLEHLISRYDGEIRYTDHHLGRLFQRLESLGLKDNTIVAVTSDHGDEFFDHQRKGHRKSLYEESLRVPLLIRYPERIGPGLVVREPAQLMDIAPTLLSLAGLEIPERFGTATPKHPYAERDLTPLLLERTAEGIVPSVPCFGELEDKLAGIRREKHKLILNLEDPTKLELYDLESDPQEQTNLMTLNPEIAEELQLELLAWRDHWDPGEKEQQKPIELDEDHLQELRDLGYLK